MSRIKKLKSNIVNNIAAGEIIEGPSSVVKELIENSIDANSSKIEIHIEDSGSKVILVKDNGCGMSKSDLNMAVFNYPILMASDILSYDIDIVPV